MTAQLNLPVSVDGVADGWVAVCPVDRLQPERGVAALVSDHQVAVFRTFDGMLYAVDNRDPFSGQYVLSRGIVGTHGDAPTVASPLYKQAFDLRTGVCVTDETVRIDVYEARRRDGQIQVRPRQPGTS